MVDCSLLEQWGFVVYSRGGPFMTTYLVFYEKDLRSPHRVLIPEEGNILRSYGYNSRGFVPMKLHGYKTFEIVRDALLPHKDKP